VPTVRASRELLAPLDDVWSFVAEPHNLPNWWPKMGGVHPDRRGLAPGARWQVTGENQPSLLRRPEAVGQLIVLAVEPKRRLAFQLTGDRLEVELRLEPALERTKASLRVQGPWLIGLSRALPREALNRLHALCQTGAEERGLP
jgi:uncharacterized protein YndB with AHSA1/START domain